MSLYAIGDLHLSLSTDKPMDVFGSGWENYIEKIRAGFSELNNDDVCVVCGDISWAMDLSGALEDFRFIDALPGKKIVLKGNHDYWWNTMSKVTAFFVQNGIGSIDILHNNCYFYGDTAICGTRGWFFEEEVNGGEHDRKIMNRELIRLEASLKKAGSAEKICFLHYPPVYTGYVCSGIVDLLAAYNVQRCFYGHIHGSGKRYAIQDLVNGVDYRLVAADNINFSPIKILG